MSRRFNITAPDGRVVVVEGDEAPSDEEAEEIFDSLPAKPRSKGDANGFDPTVMKSVVAAINTLTKTLKENPAPSKPPQINVEAPKVNVEAPVVNIPARPEHWRLTVVSHDDNGRIKEVDLKVIK